MRDSKRLYEHYLREAGQHLLRGRLTPGDHGT
jgi:hypothetical protein